MNLADAIRTRRSVRQFTSRAVTRDELEQLVAAATLAPNHRLTQPWRFYVMGPEARRAYGAVLGARKAKKLEDPVAAQVMIDKVAAAGAALPAQVAVTMVLAESPETREEDYGATWMAVQNLSLTAHALGLGSHIKTGAIMEDPRARAALGVPEGERIIALVDIGEPAEQREPMARRPAAEVTTWLG
jgi:nitroreductase